MKNCWFLLILLLGCSSEQPDSILVYGAASTVDALSEVAELYETKQGISIRLSFAGSSTLARQIEAGAPAHVFLSANPHWMGWLRERELLDTQQRCNLLHNRLVLAAHPREGPDFIIEAAADLPRQWPHATAMGDPQHVPAGQYGRQALAHHGWWQEMEDKMVLTPDVRAAVRLVNLGEVNLGLIYATDIARTHLRLCYTFPLDSHDPIIYPLARTRLASPYADGFYRFLQSEEAAAVFRKHGFMTADQRAK